MKLRRVPAFTFCLLVSTTLSGVALAADVETVPYQHDWTGLYVGGHVGYGWIDLKGAFDSFGVPEADFIDDARGSFELDDADFLGGAQIGYNVQIDKVVLGIEGDISFTSWKDSLTNRDNDRVAFDTDYFATLRARAGYAIDNVLLFATAGAAWTDTEFSGSDAGGGAPGQTGELDLDDVGFVAGGGAELALDEDWSIKAEALYAVFDQNENTENLTSEVEIGDYIKLDDVFVVRVGINFHL